GGAVAVEQVIKTELRLRGTRSESVSIDAEVRQSLYGHLGDTVNMRRYTRRGDLVLTPRQFYVVALRVEPRYSPRFAVEDVLAVPEPPCLVEGETVLVWCASAPEERGVILGSVRPSASTARPDRGPGDEMVLEAKRRLTLKCGDGSITIREDGKILIKGKDL